MRTIKILSFVAALSNGAMAVAADLNPINADPAIIGVVTNLRKLYPATNFKEIRSTPMTGIYEVVMGQNIAYVDESGRYFVFGHLFDMREQRDLSEERITSARQMDFNALPLKDAIITVKGNGKRKMAVFSDPDCPFCKQLEGTLASVNDVTINTFLFPLESLHPDARRKAVGVWCSKDRARAWDDLMHRGTVPTEACEDTPIERNLRLAGELGITGTPTIIFESGASVPGAPKPDQLNRMLGSTK
jgi:thiol:disulfide interchange protein DsbC